MRGEDHPALRRGRASATRSSSAATPSASPTWAPRSSSRCSRTLKALLEGLAGVERVIGRGEDLPPFDYHTPLPQPCRWPSARRSSRFPRPGAYLDVAAHHPARVQAWQARLGGGSRPRIGLVLVGQPGAQAATLSDRSRARPVRSRADARGRIHLPAASRSAPATRRRSRRTRRSAASAPTWSILVDTAALIAQAATS